MTPVIKFPAERAGEPGRHRPAIQSQPARVAVIKPQTTYGFLGGLPVTMPRDPADQIPGLNGIGFRRRAAQAYFQKHVARGNLILIFKIANLEDVKRFVQPQAKLPGHALIPQHEQIDLAMAGSPERLHHLLI